MYIKESGIYLALCDQYLILFRAVGSFPFFRIPSGMILNNFNETGEVRVVKENDIEIQGIYSNPDKYAFATLTGLLTGFKEIKRNTVSGKIIIEPEFAERYKEKLRLIDTGTSGIPINSLAMDIVIDNDYSLPQAYLTIQELRKLNKHEKR